MGVLDMNTHAETAEFRSLGKASLTSAFAATVWVIFFAAALGQVGWTFSPPALLLSLAAIGLGVGSLMRRQERGFPRLLAVGGLALGLLIPAMEWWVLVH